MEHERGIQLTNPAPDNTRERLLMQAELLFAQKGFAAVSVREITTAAECNLAAVNYHFGNKINLYLSVFKERWVPRIHGVRKYFQDYLAKKNDFDTSDIVRAFATAFLEGAMTDDEKRCHIHLMLRELTHPTEAISIVVEEVIRPMHHDIRELLRPSFPEKIDLEQLTLSIFSMISMILYFEFARPVVSLVMDQEFDPQFKSRVIDHIVSFTMNGINGFKEGALKRGFKKEKTI